jgi:hypothetical protein
MNTIVWTVNDVEEVKEKVQQFIRAGYPDNSIYVLTHDSDRTKRVAEETNTDRIGLIEEGLGTSIANIFRSRGDELRSKLRSLGVSKSEAERLEAELDKDKIVVIGWGGQLFTGDNYDESITYSAYEDSRL